MVQPRTHWFLLGPLLVGVGCVIGAWGRSADAATHPTEPTPRAVGMPSLAPIVDQVRPGVVSIQTIHLPGATVELAPDLAGDSSDGVSRGTGFVLHEDGLVLTAHHVVSRPSHIIVDVKDLGRFEAEMVGEDPTTDLAVIRLIDPPDDLQVLELCEDVRQGDWVVTIGNPWGKFQHSVGFGVVAFEGRHLIQDGMGVTNDYLQFSAPTHPGHSGSPVFDMRGRVLGLTTRTHRESQDLSFALPVKVIRNVLASMEANEGRARRAYAGIRFQPMTRSLAKSLGVPDGEGVLITNIRDGSPAQRAGLQEEDVLLKFDAVSVADVSELHDRITWSPIGRSIPLRVMRAGAVVDLTVELDPLSEPSEDLRR